MIHVLLLILKIILWVILALTALALLIILLLLFAPVKYRADILWNGERRVKAKVSFLVVSVNLLYENATKDLDFFVRVLGIRFGGRKKSTEKKKKTKYTSSDESEEDLKKEDMPDFSIASNDSGKADKKEEEVEEAEEAEEVKEDKKEVKKEKKKAEKDKKEKKDKKAALMGKLDGLKKFWELECTVQTRAYLKKYILGVIRHVGPRRVKGYLIFGFDDPCTTGNVTGYISLFPFAYQKNFDITPDFYNKVLKCDVKLKGHMFLGYFLRIVLNINIWRTLKAAKKYLAD